jgi:hypothetical protein
MHHCHALRRVGVEYFADTWPQAARSTRGGSGGIATGCAAHAEPWPPRNFDIKHAAEKALQGVKVRQIDRETVLENQTVKHVGMQREGPGCCPRAGSNGALAAVDERRLEDSACFVPLRLQRGRGEG